jgi:hypothetical protein
MYSRKKANTPRMQAVISRSGSWYVSGGGMSAAVRTSVR